MKQVNIYQTLIFLLTGILSFCISANGQMTLAMDSIFDRASYYYNHDQLDSSEFYYNIAFENADLESKLKGLSGIIKVNISKNEFEIIERLIVEGDRLVKGMPYNKEVANYNLMKGEFYRKASRLQEALPLHLETVRRSKDLKDGDEIYADALLYSALTYERMARYDSSLVYASLAYNIFAESIDTNSIRFGTISNSVGVCFFRSNQFAQAKKCYLKAKNIAEQSQGPTSSDLSIVLGNLAALESVAQNYSTAIKYAEQGLKINKALRDEEGMSFNYYSLGVYHYYLGDYGRAKDYLEACIEIRERIFHPLHSRLVWPYQVLGIALKESGDYERTLYYNAKSRKILIANFGEGSLDEGYLNENIATIFLNQGQVDSALVYIKKASHILLDKLSETDYSLSIHYFSLANVYFTNEEYNKANKYIDQSIRFLEKNGYTASGDYAQNLALKALIESELGHVKIADDLFAQSMQIIGQGDDFMFSQSAFWILGSYIDYQYTQYKNTGDREALQRFNKYSDMYLALSNVYRKQFNDPYTKSALIKDNVRLYNSNIGIYNALYRETNDPQYLESAYAFSENGRTALLRDMLDEKIQHYAGVADTIVEKEIALQKEVSRLNQSFLEYPDSVSIKKQLFETKERLNEHIKNVLASHPHYYDMKFNSRIPELAVIKQKIGGDENLLEYMKDDTAYYVLLLNNNESELKYLGSKSKINDAVDQWRSYIINQNLKGIHDISRTLYHYLIEPVAPLLIGHRIIIVPSGPLFYLNFETLISDPQERAYLIYDYNISYALSFNVLYSEASNKSLDSKSMSLAIAPGFEDDMKSSYTHALDTMEFVDNDFLYTLRQPWTVKLADKLKQEYRNIAFTGFEATESNIKSKLHTGNVLYFGTHAIANSDDPLRSKLVLAKEIGPQNEDGYLHAYELYGLSLNADIAVLNACESGIGHLQEGEGMISLAYSLNFAGCPSTVMSLWKVDEKTNTAITDMFFENLANGQLKSEALRNAKLEYLATADALRQHPYFWSGMVLMGKDGEVHFNKNTNPFIYIFAAVIFILIILLWKRYRNQ